MPDHRRSVEPHRGACGAQRTEMNMRGYTGNGTDFIPDNLYKKDRGQTEASQLNLAERLVDSQVVGRYRSVRILRSLLLNTSGALTLFVYALVRFVFPRLC